MSLSRRSPWQCRGTEEQSVRRQQRRRPRIPSAGPRLSWCRQAADRPLPRGRGEQAGQPLGTKARWRVARAPLRRLEDLGEKCRTPGLVLRLDRVVPCEEPVAIESVEEGVRALIAVESFFPSVSPHQSLDGATMQAHPALLDQAFDERRDRQRRVGGALGAQKVHDLGCALDRSYPARPSVTQASDPPAG